MMHFQLVSSSGVKFDGEAYEVLVPTKGGTIALFEDHMPLISAAQGGVVSVRVHQSDRDNEMKHFAVNGGVVQIEGQNLKFLSDDVTSSEEVNEKEAEAALARAKALIDGASDRRTLHEAHRSLHHSTAQLQIARLKQRHHN